jgi:hypothetical protein
MYYVLRLITAQDIPEHLKRPLFSLLFSGCSVSLSLSQCFRGTGKKGRKEDLYDIICLFSFYSDVKNLVTEILLFIAGMDSVKVENLLHVRLLDRKLKNVCIV